MHIEYQRVTTTNTYRAELFVQDMTQPHWIIGSPCFELTLCPHRSYSPTPYEPLKMRKLIFLEKPGSNYPFMLLTTENKEKLKNPDN